MAAALLNALKALPADPRRRIRLALAFRDQKQIELAKMAGIDTGLLSNAMNGHRNLTDSQEQAVADALGVPVSALFPKVAA